MFSNLFWAKVNFLIDKNNKAHQRLEQESDIHISIYCLPSNVSFLAKTNRVNKK